MRRSPFKISNGISIEMSSKMFYSPKRIDSSLGQYSALDDEENNLSISKEENNEFEPASDALLLGASVGLGILVGGSVTLFKLMIASLRTFLYSHAFTSGPHFSGIDSSYFSDLSSIPMVFIPAVGGVGVSLLAFILKKLMISEQTTNTPISMHSNEFSTASLDQIKDIFPPGLQGVVDEVVTEERYRNEGFSEPARWFRANGDRSMIVTNYRPLRSILKTGASVSTLGSGCSLGPEGPAVEIGMGSARLINGLVPSFTPSQMRLLVSCGAAAGVSAGFNAPIAGVFFALEIVQSAFNKADEAGLGKSVFVSLDEDNRLGSINFPPLTTKTGLTAVLLTSVVAAVVSKVFLGEEYALEVAQYSLKSPLYKLPLYLMLGTLSGTVAFIFGKASKASKDFFDGNIEIASFMKNIPAIYRPILGGLFCGVVGLFYPQILFNGYDTLNALLADKSATTASLLILLIVKTLTTAVSLGSGLQGGTFAPSLFLGAMLGESYRNGISGFVHLPFIIELSQYFPDDAFQLSDVRAYAMVGAASVLSAVFRAPLTGSMLIFELTRDFDVILPLLASAGVGSLVCDAIDRRSNAHSEAIAYGDDEEELFSLDRAAASLSSKSNISFTEDNSSEIKNKLTV